MPRFLVEREVPRAHAMKTPVLQELAEKSCAGIEQMNNSVRWIKSYVTRNRIVCVFEAPNEEAVREHASVVGLPAHAISEVVNSFDPSFAA